MSQQTGNHCLPGLPSMLRPTAAFERPAITPPLIDNTAYPHIVEAILDNGAHSTLLAFRQICKPYRDRVDRLLSLHLAIVATEPSFRSVLGGHPLIQPPELPANAELDRKDKATTLMCQSLPVQPRIIDCTHPELIGTDLSEIPLPFHNPATLRLWKTDRLAIETLRPETVVIFAQRIKLSIFKEFGVPTSYLPLPQSIFNSYIGLFFDKATTSSHQSLKKITLVIPLDTNASVLPTGLLWAWPELEEFVIVFVPPVCDPVHPGGGTHHPFLGNKRPVSIETEICGFLTASSNWEQRSKVRITFVNQEVIPSITFWDGSQVVKWASHLNPEEPPHLYSSLKYYVDYIDKYGDLSIPKISFLSLDEYERKVGTERFLIETDPNFQLRTE
ncbi:hypothetical protein CspHIS471_0302710 [Cutaneotrichosporon sp. HIS471]|nr:hypothetical protein CspHIS471_0302710 [Cutaneotrichosporon sp. HIS471]